MRAYQQGLLAVAASGLLLGLALFSFRAFDRIESAAKSRYDTHGVIRRAEQLLSQLKDAETAQRAYALTGDETFLEPYFAVRHVINVHVESLRRLATSDGARLSLDKIAPLVADKLANMRQVIDLRRKFNTAAVVALVGNGRGRRLMDEIRVGAERFIQLEEEALALRDIEFQSTMRRMLVLIIAANAGALLGMVLFAYFSYREAQNRVKALVHLETLHLLEAQSDLNHQLQRANQTLHASEAKLAVTLNSIGDAVLAADAEGNVVFLNPVAENFTGWKTVQALGRRAEEVLNICEEDSGQSRAFPVRETLRTGTSHVLAKHSKLIARDGSVRSIADSCAPIFSSDGELSGAVLVFRDVTKELEMDANRERSRKELNELTIALKRAAQVKSKFLANMSHELRTPLNSINGFSEILYDGTFGPLNEKQKSYVEHVLTSGRHLLLLINQILDMSKSEAGHLTLAPSLVSLPVLLAEVSALVNLMVEKKKLKLRFEIAEGLPQIVADELKVKEVIYNLLSNAIKFTPPTGQIGLRARRLGDEIEIVIWDQGMGIAAENLEKIFEGFFRLDTPYSRLMEGTGLGLPLSKKLVELHGGRLGVTSKGLNHGTEVCFTLPIA